MATTTKKKENKQVTAQEQQEPIVESMQIGQVGIVELDDDKFQLVANQGKLKTRISFNHEEAGALRQQLDEWLRKTVKKSVS